MIKIKGLQILNVFCLSMIFYFEYIKICYLSVLKNPMQVKACIRTEMLNRIYETQPCHTALIYLRAKREQYHDY